ncbi:MAG: tRNA epoxyqueuosine(34) reductase QueG [Pirellulaceae bacterium]|nr:tRNA epoxyqueuosine(34) reductase QueG [Pirellulaceae bacterium]
MSDPLTQRLIEEARRVGFDLVGVCPATNAPGISRLRQWIAAGYAGEMRYLPDRLEAYEHPDSILAGARSLIVLGQHYRTDEPVPVQPGQGRISRYAWGPADYHDLIHDRLRRLREFLLDAVPQARARGVVDTAPLLEREFGQLAGLGWIGKNTMLINKRAGSWFFLAALITDLTLDYDSPHAADHCGTCRACLDACPTGAFPEPGVLDATRCISYLTIELRDRIPEDLRAGIGDWLFGCDVCQEVCPWNRKAPRVETDEFRPGAGTNPVDLLELFRMTDEQFRRRFRHTPLWRSKRRGILRNAAIVLGNQRPPQAIDALEIGLNDAEPLVREACAWALRQFDDQRGRLALQSRLASETDAMVQTALRQALNQLTASA